MNHAWLPSNEYPGITPERLLIVGDIIRVARGEAADDHRPEKFETNWSLGVRGYERTCGALTWAAQSYPWLTIVSGAGGGPVHFVMTIGGHPVRFYRGGPDDVPERYQQTSLFELLEQQKAQEIDSTVPVGRCLRLAIENHADGRPSNIYLVDMSEDSGAVTNICLIPSVATTTTVTEFAPTVPPAVIPPVSAEALEEQDENQQDNKTGSDDE